ncbi:MAG: hypothetical protein CME15_13450 [Gemmatimonadetes bacterium]|nr:hypothetical protein [Gemmatimonadota bacterium]
MAPPQWTRLSEEIFEDLVEVISRVSARCSSVGFGGLHELLQTRLYDRIAETATMGFLQLTG